MLHFFSNSTRLLLLIVIALQVALLVILYRERVSDIHYVGFEDYKPVQDTVHIELQKQVLGAFKDFNGYYLTSVAADSNCISLRYDSVENLKTIAVDGVLYFNGEDYYWVAFKNGKKVGLCRGCAYYDVQQICKINITPSLSSN